MEFDRLIRAWHRSDEMSMRLDEAPASVRCWQKSLHPGCLFGWSRQEYFKPCQKSSVARKRSIARPSSRKTASTILNEIQQFSALQ